MALSSMKIFSWPEKSKYDVVLVFFTNTYCSYACAGVKSTVYLPTTIPPIDHPSIYPGKFNCGRWGCNVYSSAGQWDTASLLFSGGTATRVRMYEDGIGIRRRLVSLPVVLKNIAIIPTLLNAHHTGLFRSHSSC